MLEAVVHAFDQNVFDGHPLPGLELQLLQCLDQVVDGPARGAGHELLADLLRRGVQGDGRQGEAFGVEDAQLPLDGARRKGDTPTRKLEPFRVGEDLQAAPDLVPVGQGFTHAHVYEVLHLLRQPLRSQIIPGHQDLGRDLPARHVAHEAHEPRAAEGAAHGAADLAGQALGVAVLVRDEHGLDQGPVGQAQQELDRPVGAGLDLMHLGPGQRPLLRQLLPEILGDVGHGRKLANASAPQPLPQLARPELLVSHGEHGRFQFGAGQFENVAHDAPLSGIAKAQVARPPRPSCLRREKE